MRIVFAAILTLACSISIASAQTVPDKTPEDLIRFIYAQYVGKKNTDPITFQWTDKALAERLFEPALARGVVRAAEKSTIEFDPFIDGQDFEIASYELKNGEKSADRARITASFSNLGRQTFVAYDFTRTKAGWRIRDVSWPPEKRPSFRRMLKVK